MSRGFNLTAELNLRGPSNVRTIVADIRRQLGTISANVDVTVNPTTSRNINALNQSFRDFNRTLVSTRTSADSAAASLRTLSQAIGTASTASNQLPRTLRQTNTALQTLTQQNHTANASTQQLSSTFEEFGRQSALAVRRFAAFATVTGIIYKVSNAISSASREFLDFNKELVRVSQVTDTSVANLGGLVRQITELSVRFGVSSKDLIQVSSTLAQAGLSARDTEKALKALALSALAPSFDSLNDTVEGSIALMRQFGISAGDLEKALGSVNSVAAKFAVEASDIITAIQRTGGVFATASKGVSEGTAALNEFIAVFTSVRATTRESAETIATGLRTIFTRIQRGDTIEALKQYGVLLTDLSGKFVGPYEAVKRLSEGLSQLDPRDLKFSRIVEELGGFRQIGKVIPLIQQFATAQAALKVAQTGQTSLTADSIKAQAALAVQLNKVREEFVAMIRSVGQSEGFQTMVRLTLDLTSNLIRLADSAKGALPALGAIFAIRGVSALSQFGRGFLGNIRGGGQRANNGGPIRGYASGGYVPGYGDGDTVPAMLSAGEFVIRKKAVKAIGVGNLNNLNKYAGGGPIKIKQLAGSSKGGSTIRQYRDAHSDIIQNPDSVSSNIVRKNLPLTEADKKYLFRSSLSGQGSGKRFKGNITYLNKNVWGDAYENIIAKKLGSAWKRTANIEEMGPSYPLDLYNSSTGELAEVKFTDMPVSASHLISKKLRQRLVSAARTKKTGWGFTKSVGENVNLGTSTVYEPNENEKREFVAAYKKGSFDPKAKASGGIIRAFADAGAVSETGGKPASASQIIRLLGAEGAAKAGNISANEVNRILRIRKPNSMEAMIQNKIIQEYQKKVNRQSGAQKAQATRLTSKGLLFGAAGMFGSAFAPVNKTIESNLLKSPVSVRIMSGIMNASAAQSVDDMFGASINKTANKAAKKIMVADILAKAGLGRELNLDFDRTLAFGADKILADPKTPKFAEFGDRTKVAGALKTAKLSLLGKELAGLVANRPELLGNLRLITARPPSTLDLIQNWLSSKGLPIPLSQFKGLGGPGVSGSQIAKLKAALLNPGSLFVDDDARNIKAARQRSKEGIESYRYGNRKSTTNVNGDATAQGIIFEKVIEKLGGPLALKGGGLDFPQGLKGAAKYFGIPGNIPTDAKRTISGPSTVEDNIITYLRTKGYATGGHVEDKIPALLTPGEFVINRKAASRIGLNRLNKLNHADKISGYNKGGSVGHIQRFSAGGSPAPGDAEARIQRVMMLFESFLNNAQNQAYKQNRSAGNSAETSLNNARRVALKEFADASLQVVRNAHSFEDAMEKSEASSRVISQYIQRSSVSAKQASVSSGLISKTFTSIQTRLGSFYQNVSSRVGGRLGGLSPNFSNLGLSLAFIGPMIGDAIANSIGSGSQAKGYSAAIGGITSAVGVGAQFGPYGAFAGALLGAANAVDNFAAGVADAETEISKNKIESRLTDAEKIVDKLNKPGSNSSALGVNLVSQLRQIGFEEEKIISNQQLKKQPGVVTSTLDKYFGKNSLETLSLGFYSRPQESAKDIAEQQAGSNKAGADLALKALSARMEAGSSFNQALQSFGGGGSSVIKNQIVEANKAYTEEINSLIAQNEQGLLSDDALREQKNKLVDKYFLIETEALRALDADKQKNKATQKLAQTINLMSVSITQTFENMDQALNRASLALENASIKSDQIMSNQVSMKTNLVGKNVLQNPNVYSSAQKMSAARQVSGMFGTDAKFVEGLMQFGTDAENTIKKIAVDAQQQGGNPATIGDTITRQLTDKLIATFGDNRITDTIREQLKTSIAAQAKANNGEINPQQLLEEVSGLKNLVDASKQSLDALIKQYEFAEKALSFFGEEVQKAADIEIQIRTRAAATFSSLSNSYIKAQEAMGKEVPIEKRLAVTRFAGSIQAGVSPNNFNATGLSQRRASLMSQRDNQQRQLAQLENSGNGPLQINQIANLKNSIAKLNTAIKNTENSLEALPGTIESNINDIIGEIQRVNSERESRIQAGTGFAEKLVGSTREELQNLNTTYAVLDQTLNGNLVTMNRSVAAQKAFYETLQKGGTYAEAMGNAEQAFAAQTRDALDLFNQLVQMSGVKGQEVNNIRATLLENFARAQGMGLENSPMFRQIITLLRQPTEEDKQIQKLNNMLAEQQRSLLEANKLASDQLLTKQADIIANANQGLIAALNNAAAAFNNAQNNNAGQGIARPGQVMQPPAGQRPVMPGWVQQPVFPWPPQQNRSSGGIIYASTGGFLSKGTDTVPAMLTRGEFIVNQKASSKNLGLLKFMNEGGEVEVPAFDQAAFDAKLRARVEQQQQQTMAEVDAKVAADKAIRDKQYEEKALADQAEEANKQARVKAEMEASDARVKAQVDEFSKTQGAQAFEANSTKIFEQRAQAAQEKEQREFILETARRRAQADEASRQKEATAQQNRESSRLLILTNKSEKGKKLTPEEDMELATLERSNGVPFMKQRGSVASHTTLQRAKEQSLTEEERSSYLAGRTKQFKKDLSKAKEDISPSSVVGGIVTAGIYSAAGATDVTDKEINAQPLTTAISIGGELATDPTSYLGFGAAAKGARALSAAKGASKTAAQGAARRTVQFIPLEGLQTAGKNAAKKAEIAAARAESAAQAPIDRRITRFLERGNAKEAAEAAAKAKPKPISAATSTPTPVVKPQVGPAVPKASSTVSKPKLGEKFRGSLTEKAGLSDRDVAKVVDDMPTPKRKVYEITDDASRITAKDRQNAVKAVTRAQRKAARKKTTTTLASLAMKPIGASVRAFTSATKFAAKGLLGGAGLQGGNLAYQSAQSYLNKPKNKSRGGLIYASRGQLIPYEPKGTDTVPAMLTPGEFVVNREATRENLPLLKQINKMARGGTVKPIYANNGMQVGNVGISSGRGAPDNAAVNVLNNILQQIINLNKNIIEMKHIEIQIGPGETKPENKNSDTKNKIMNQGDTIHTPNFAETGMQQAFREGRSLADVKKDRIAEITTKRQEAYQNNMQDRRDNFQEARLRNQVMRGVTPSETLEAFQNTRRNAVDADKERAGGQFSVPSGPAPARNNNNQTNAGVSNNGNSAINLDGLSQFTTAFDTFIGQLQKINLPPVINVMGNHKVEVVINGAEVFNRLQPSISRLVVSEVGNAMKNLSAKTEGAI